MQTSRKWTLAAAMMLTAPAWAVEGTGELYGDIRYAVINFKNDGQGQDTDAASTNSHLGGRLSVAEGAFSATFIYERSLGNDAVTNGDDVRQSNVQIGSPYGTVIYGRAPTAYKIAGQKLDPFYNTGIGTINGEAFSNAGAAVQGPSFGLSALTSDTFRNGFIDNQLAYVSPKLFGVTVNAVVFFDERTDDDGEQHDYGFGAEWSAKGLTVGAQYLDLRSTAATNPLANFNAGLPVPTKATRVYGGYKTDHWGVSASWEPLDLKDGGLDRDYYYGAGWVKVLENTSLAASYGYVEGTPFEGDSFSLGVFQTLFAGLEVYAAGRYTDRDVTPSNANGLSSRDVTVGVNYQFSLSRGMGL